MQLLTPARLAALVGVLTGLSAAVTSALNVIPHDTAVGRAVVASVGVIGTVITIAKFLEGQAGWEQQAAQHQHNLQVKAIDHYHAAPTFVGGKVKVLPIVNLPQTPKLSDPPVLKFDVAVLPDEQPLVGVDDGQVDLLITPDGEPQRQADQAQGV